MTESTMFTDAIHRKSSARDIQTDFKSLWGADDVRSHHRRIILTSPLRNNGATQKQKPEISRRFVLRILWSPIEFDGFKGQALSTYGNRRTESRQTLFTELATSKKASQIDVLRKVFAVRSVRSVCRFRAV